MQNIARQKIVKGFTLIELMIVVAIIGILAAIAVPNFVKFQCRSKQSEARGNLKALYVAQESFKAEFDSYGDVANIDGAILARAATNQIGFQPKGDRLRYQYVAVDNGATGTAAQFDGSAIGGSADSQDMLTDLWSVTELNDVCLGPINRGQVCAARTTDTSNACD